MRSRTRRGRSTDLRLAGAGSARRRCFDACPGMDQTQHRFNRVSFAWSFEDVSTPSSRTVSPFVVHGQGRSPPRTPPRTSSRSPNGAPGDAPSFTEGEKSGRNASTTVRGAEERSEEDIGGAGGNTVAWFGRPRTSRHARNLWSPTRNAPMGCRAAGGCVVVLPALDEDREERPRNFEVAR
eukprot:scaffold932_cov328-Pavlova_lutheri.AAC.55